MARAARSKQSGRKSAEPARGRPRQRLRLPRHGAFYLAAGAGVVIFAVFFAALRDYAVDAGLIALFATYLGVVAYLLPGLTAEELKKHADEADAPAGLIFVLMAAVVVAAAIGLFLLVNASQSPSAPALALGVLAVLLGWLAIHTMLGLHYAYEYHEAGDDLGKGEGRKSISGGLDFPGRSPPNGSDFIYFSFVIATTAQVSDVSISSSRMRRLVLWHSIFSYFFTTVILAAAINVVVSLGG